MPYNITGCPICGNKLDSTFIKPGRKKPLLDPRTYEKIGDTYDNGDYVWLEALLCRQCNIKYRYSIRAFTVESGIVEDDSNTN